MPPSLRKLGNMWFGLQKGRAQKGPRKRNTMFEADVHQRSAYIDALHNFPNYTRMQRSLCDLSDGQSMSGAERPLCRCRRIEANGQQKLPARFAEEAAFLGGVVP